VRLSDIMSSMQLSSYAEVALLLFIAAFVGITVAVFRRDHAAEWERCRHLPLDEREDAAPDGASEGSSPRGVRP
jgi:hypothetical protein